MSNQVKDQVGRVVKECVVTIPAGSTDDYLRRLIEAAKLGGLRVKGFIQESNAALLAHKLDDPAIQERRIVLVLDIGWSHSEVTCLEVNPGGLLCPLASEHSSNGPGAAIIDGITKHCAKDFQRKSKVSCLENGRSMMRIASECEGVVRTLSTAAEATVDIDSLCEGIDYSGKISRVRFEDLSLAVFLSVKELTLRALEAAASAGFQSTDVTHIIYAGAPFHLLKYPSS